MGTRKSEWLASIKPILDRDEATRDAKELARELGDILEINIDANPENLKQLIDEFNKQLSKMGKQPIVFSEKTLHGIVGQFANAVAEGFAKGADTGVAEALKRQLEGLKKQRQEIVKEQDKINKNVKARRRMETLESFEIETAHSLTVKGDVGKEAQRLVEVLYESADQIAQAEKQYGKTSIKYRDAVLDAQEAYNKYLRMQKTLKSMSVSERLSIPKDVRASYDLLGKDRDAYEAAGGINLPFDEDFVAEKILDAFEELSDIFEDSVDKAIEFKKQLQQIDAQIDSITKKIQEVGVTDDSTFAYAKDGLKTLQEIEAAYDRISKKKATNGGHKSIDKVTDALEYTPGSASLTTLRNRYNTSLSAGEDWEVQYQWLVKFVKEYEASLARINAEENKTDKKNHLATLKKYTELYNSVKPIAAGAEASLLEVAKKAGYQSDKYSGDVGSGDVVDAQAAQKAREEADKKAEAEKRAEESLKRQRIEEERIAEAKEKQRLEEERIAEAKRKAAEDAERERRDGLPAGNAVEGNSAGRNDVTLADVAQDLGGKEKFAYLNTDTGKISEYIEGGYEGVAKTAMKELLNSISETMNATIHSHPESIAAPSDDDIQSFVNDIGEFKRNFILAGKQLAEIDFSELTRNQAQTIADVYKANVTSTEDERYERLMKSPLKELGISSVDSDRVFAAVSEQLKVRFPALLSDIDAYIENLRAIFTETPIIDLSQSELEDVISDEVESDFKNQDRNQQSDIYQITKELIDNVTGIPAMYQQELQNIFKQAIEYLDFDASKIFKLYDVDDFQAQLDASRKRAMEGSSVGGIGADGASSDDIESLRKQLAAKDREIAEANRRREEAELSERVAQDEASAQRHATEAAEDEISQLQEQKNLEIEAKDAEIAQIRETSKAELEAANNEKATLQNDLDLARQQAQSAQDELEASQAREAEISKKLAEQEALNRQLRESLANVKTVGGGEQASVSSEELKNVLGSIVYNVKIAYDDNDKQTNKIAIDEHTLEETLKRVFAKELNPQIEQTDPEQKNEPWALEETLQTVKRILDTIQTNTAKIDQAPQMPPDDTDSTLTQISKNIAEINSKIVKGAKATTKDTTKSQKTSVNRDAQILTERIETQKLALKKFKTELETSGRMTDEMSKKIRGLAISLGMVKDDKGLTRWGQKFQQQRLSVGITDIGNKESISDQNANIKEWISLSKKLGELDTKINSGLFDDTIILQAKQEREFVLKRIDDLMELINNPNSGFIAAGEANFAGHYDTIGAQWSKLVGRLASKYDKLGELEARAETSGAFEDREKYSQLEKEIQAEVEKLRLNEEQNAELLKILQKRQEIAYINAKDIEYAKEQKRLFAEYANLVKQIGKLDGVINSDTADEISRLNAQIEKDALMRLVDNIRPKLDLTREDLMSLTATNMQGEETSTVYQRQTALTNLAKQYKELGKLQAQGAHTQVVELQKKIDAQRIVLKLTQEEQDTLTQIAENARQDARNKRKDQDATKMDQREAMLGKAGNAVGRAETAWMNAVDIEGELPADFTAKIDEYYQKLDALRKKHQELKNSDMISDEQKKELLAQTLEINKLTDEIVGLVSEYQKLSGPNVTVIGKNKLDFDADLDAYNRQLKQAVMTATNGKANIKNFDAATGTLTYTVKTGAHEFTEYTAAVRRADGALVSVRGATKKTETFFEATARKMRELTSYFSGMAVFNRIGQELRRGIQYIREIDLALTELKKVTNETEQTYDKFLDTAAKTAARLGSTMKEVISSTADFSRVGYTLEQSATLAESALTLMNTSEYTDIGSASEALISALKAYGYAAEESMHVVDIFNEIGENYCRCA